MPSLLLIRHGQSEWNALGRWQGQADPPLTELGRRQAKAAATTLAGWPADRAIQEVASSTLIRSRSTAEAIADHLNLSAPNLEPLLVERDAGEWSGLTKAEIEEQYPGYLQAGKRPPSYESDEQLLPRVIEGLKAVASAATAERLAVVVHGGVIYVLEEAFGLSFQRIGNLGAVDVSVVDGEIELGDRIELLGDEIEATVPDQI